MRVLRKLSMRAAFSFAVFSLNNIIMASEELPFIMENQSMYELSTYSADQIEPLLPVLQEWGECAFIQYPYLWVPAKGEIFAAYTLLAREKKSLVAIVRNKGEIIGLAGGVPFDCEELQELFDEDPQIPSDFSLRQKMKEQGFDATRMFYMSFFLTAPKYHNDENLVELIYNHFIDFIHSIGRTQICYFDDQGRADHPLKPEKLKPIEPWGHIIPGFRSMDMKKQFSWPTLQLDASVKDETHSLEFFVKDI